MILAGLHMYALYSSTTAFLAIAVVALATMCLEVYYRYDADKIGRDPWLAARSGTLRR